ncbi:ribonuclease catalytic domain-containing protein [candidate division KSB1 bacterium]|nr:ribonuclease catalytic domain-containing protein [candidate division KSB1 bacterium]
MSKKIDLMQNRPRRGSVVLFVARNGKVRLGEVIADPVAAQEELQVQDTGSARSRIKFRDVLLNLGAAANGLAAKQLQIEQAAAEIDLALLLEAHPEWHKGAGIAVSAIAEEYFGKNPKSDEEAAMFLALQRDNRFALSGEKALYRPPAPVRRQRHSEQERQQLFETLRATMTEALQKNWGAAEIDTHPFGKKLARLARATLEQRRFYPETWRKEFVLHLHSLNTLTGYRDARHLLFDWLKKIGRVSPQADVFIFSEPVLRRHNRRLQMPVSSEQLSVISEREPVISEQLSVSGNQKLKIGNENPVAIIEQPATSIQYPASSIQNPELVVTIDNPETTDRDDALSLRRTEIGVEIGVHTPLLEVLAPKGTLFDEWAYDVGASAYLPHRKVPMLPADISEGLGSLNAGGEKPVLSFYFSISADHPPRLSRVVCERITIGLNTNYESVEASLMEASWDQLAKDGSGVMTFKEGANAPWPPGFDAALRVWAHAAVQLENRRLENGAKIFNRDEIDVRVGADGIVHLRRISRDSIPHKMVAEWMIAVNQAAAQFCHENNLPCIYRVQESIAPEREDEDGAGRSHVRAQLKPERAPHRDLGVDGYTQITSPLRRYSDLVMQRQIVSFLQTGKPHYSQTDLWARALSIEEMTRRIQRLESRAELYWKCVYLSQHLGETYTARLGRSQGYNPRIILQIADLDLRLYVPPSGIEGIEERKIPPHYSPKEVQAVCLAMDADKAAMRFQIT